VGGRRGAGTTCHLSCTTGKLNHQNQGSHSWECDAFVDGNEKLDIVPFLGESKIADVFNRFLLEKRVYVFRGFRKAE
jgi:hypothetical protein